MNTRSLRFQLIAWHAGWLSALFLIFGLFVYGSLAYYLTESQREALARRSRQVADRAIVTTDWIHFTQQVQHYFAPEANNRFTRVTVDGVVTYTSGAPSDGGFDPATIPMARWRPSTPERVEWVERLQVPGGARLQMTMLHVEAAGRKILVEEGATVAGTKAALQRWVVALAGGLGLLIVGAVVGGHLLVQRALKPVDQIIRSAERISSRNLSERLEVSPTGDELEHLSTALNHMIRRLDEGFQHSQRFLADASHEMRTPLTIIQAELEAILERPGLRDAVSERAASTLEEVERLKNIVEGLFALSRLEAGEAIEAPVVFDLGELAATTTEQMCLLAEDKDIVIECRADRDVRVEGSRARLKEVIVNLLDNAIKYTPAGGQIRVDVTSGARRAAVEVADNGIGIPAEAIPHVFERFFRVDPARSRLIDGAGLGLSIVQTICAAHGGSVSVRSQVGQGSRFRVELPLASHAGG